MNDENTPVFNMGLAYLQRVDFLQRRCNDFSISGDNELWYKTIKALYRELSPLMTDEEREMFNDIIKRCVVRTVKGYKKGLEYLEAPLESGDTYLKMIIDRQKWINPKRDDPSLAVLNDY